MYLELWGDNHFNVFENDDNHPHFCDELTVLREVEGFMFILCVQGTARIRINLAEYSIETKTIVSLPPHFIIEFVELSNDFKIKWVFYSLDFSFDIRMPGVDFTQEIQENPCVKVLEEQQRNLLALFTAIINIYKRKLHLFRNEIAKNNLSAFIYEIAAIYLSSNAPHHNTFSRRDILTGQFLKLVLKHCRQERRVKFYADKLCITPQYLLEVVKDKSKKTPNHWINASVLVACKSLLKTTDMPVNQIAEELNFPNPSFLGRFFKKHTGTTPLKYRRS